LKGFQHWERKGGKEGTSHRVGGSVGPDFYPEAVFEFPVESRSEFTNENPLRGYDNRKEDWPKCMHGEDCLVQMMAEGTDGGRRFFKCS
jgi:hypothetical protein